MQHQKQLRTVANVRLKHFWQCWLLLILFGLSWGRAVQAQETKAQAVKTDLTPGFVLIDDIQVPAHFAAPSATAYTISLWPDGEVPYVFDENVTASNQDAMHAALAEWENVAGVHFRLAQDDDLNHVYIQNSTGNNSAIGMAGGRQIINIVSWGSKFIIVHELGHCLGFWHEQSRPDRNDYVEIVAQNIQPGREHNFDIVNNASTFGPYDFDSVMHYNRCTFSTGCPAGQTCNCAAGTETVLVREPYRAAWQNKIGQRNHLSLADRAVMQALYPVFVDLSYTGSTQKGTYRQPFRGFAAGVKAVFQTGTLIVRPGSYAAVGFYDKPLTIKAPQGGVTLGNKLKPVQIKPEVQ